VGKLIDFLRERMGPHWGSQLVTWISGLIVGIVLLRLCVVFGHGQGDLQGIYRNILLCVVSALVGWIVGMYFSPFDKRDEERFQYLGKTVAAFASGYLLSTVQPIITEYAKKAKDDPSTIPWGTVGLASASFLLAALVVFISRSYAARDDADEREAGKPSPSI
jgi:hypothetical protein